MIRLFNSNRNEGEPEMQDLESSNVTELRRATSESEYDILVADYKDALVSLDKIPAFFRKMTQSHEEMRVARAELEGKNSELNNECQRYKETALRYENDVVRLREREETLKMKLDQESRNLKVMQDYRVNAEADLREFKARVFESEKKLEKITPIAKSLAKEKDVLDATVEKLISQKTSLEKANSDYDGKLQETRETLSTLEAKTDFLQRAKVELEKASQSLREELASKDTILKVGEAKLEQAENKINQLSLEIAGLSKENEHIVRAREESNRALNNELESARTRARTMEGILEEARARSRVDSQRTAEVRKENVQLALDISQKDVVIKSLNEQLSESGARSQIFTDLQTEMDNRHADLLDKNKKLQDELNMLREENANVYSQKESAEKTIDAIQNDFKSTTSMFEKRLRNLESENADLRKQARLDDEQRIADSRAEDASQDEGDKVVPIK
jgi:chromosome segregation ATPase